jgi:hypothetical protein
MNLKGWLVLSIRRLVFYDSRTWTLAISTGGGPLAC